MLNIGIAGIGFMGRIHFLAAQRLKAARVSAICSRDAAKRAGDWGATRGNFGPEPGHVDLRDVTAYERFEDMLADPAIDLVDICTVTDQHAALAIQALKAGKHVLVEKAIALTLAEADAMQDAARQAGKLLLVAHVLPFFPEFAYAYEAVRSVRFGALRGGHFTRVIAQPDWSANIGNAARTGGPAVDLHIHDTHFIQLLAGRPRGVFSSGVVTDGVVDYLSTQYLYDGGPSLTCASGAIAMKGRPFVHGFEIYLEHATLSHSSSGVPLTVFHADGNAEIVTLPGGGDPIEAFTDELSAAVESARNGVVNPVLDSALARDALALCFLEIESVKSRRAVPC